VTRRRLAVLTLLLLFAALECRPARKKLAPIEADQTRPAQEWLRMEPVRLLHDYVALDTSVDHGEEEGARFVKRLFDCDGIENEIVCPAPARCNLLARLPGKKREGALLLLNHIDVVQAFGSLWKDAQPFEAKIKLGYLYGRGAYDMKSLGLAQALALREVKRLGVVPASDILFLGEADEESHQRLGSRWLLEHRPEWFSGVSAVLNEGGTNEVILRNVRFWGIETVIAGYGLIEFESDSGKAIADLAGRWTKLSSPVVEPIPDVVAGFDMLANHLVHPLTDPLRHLDRVIRNPAELSALPDRYASFLEARIKWIGPYLYPPDSKDNFRAYVVVSTPPGIAPDSYLSKIEADAVPSGIRIASRYSTGATTASPFRTASGELVPLLALIQRVTEARYPGVPFGPVPTFGGGSTSIYFREREIPAYGYSSVPVNIADAARRHGNDERIFLRDYVEGVDTFKEVLLEFAQFGNEKLPPPRARN